MIDFGSWAEEPEFSIGDTTFFIRKFGAIAGWTLLERIRAALGEVGIGEVLGSTNPGRNLAPEAMSGILDGIMRLPTKFVVDLRNTLFASIQFRNGSAVTYQSLHGAEDTAFDGLQPTDVYTVMFRSLSVNYAPFFRGLGSLPVGGGAVSTGSP